MKARELCHNILWSFEFEGNSTIIKAVKNRYRLVVSRLIDHFIDPEYKSITIKISEYIKELNKHDFTLEDLEAGLILYMLITLFWGRTEEIILDFENVSNEELDDIIHYIIIESIERLSYEHGKFLKEYVKIINVPDKVYCTIDNSTYKKVIEDAMLVYKHNKIAYKEYDDNNN